MCSVMAVFSVEVSIFLQTHDCTERGIVCFFLGGGDI